jgi:acetylornithine deacetylase/succinyl-diaminopimelate desuccinylase-like protein
MPSAPADSPGRDPTGTHPLPPKVAAAAHDELVQTLRDLIRIPSVNPAPVPGAETAAARWIAGALEDAGLRPEVLEPIAGRGSVVARLRGDGTGGEPLLLLSHLDVVPAGTGDWTHDPFGADVADGYVWGRGAVDMKALVAMEIQVLRLLASEARAAGRNPADDPIPGLRRDVLFACTADEEAGGLAGLSWIVDHRPELVRAAGAVNESGAIATTVAGRRFYPIGVAEKGYAVYRLSVRGTWGHGSMPRDDNAVILAAEAVRRLSKPGAARLTPTMRAFVDGVVASLPPVAGRTVGALAAGNSALAPAALDRVCDPSQARALHALLRNTISPDVLHAGLKYNVIPGEAVLELDCRPLPGTSEAEMRAEVLDRLGDLAAASSLELLGFGPPVEGSAASELYDVLAATVLTHDPDGLPLPVMAPFSTDAKHLARIGVPCYGFSPLRLEPGERYLDRFHGVDERVGIEALRWGLPVLYDAVRRFCAASA